MNTTQIIQIAAKNLTEFNESERTQENAKIELRKVLDYNTEKRENNYITENFDYCIKRVVEKANSL